MLRGRSGREGGMRYRRLVGRVVRKEIKDATPD
jgi:hypothetical protein